MTSSSGTALHLGSLHPSLLHLCLQLLQFHLLLLQFLLLHLKCYPLLLPPPPPSAPPKPPPIMYSLYWFHPFTHRT